MRRRADAAHAGAPMPSPQEVCEPSGVPNVITLPAPVLFIQQPNQVMILYQRDHQSAPHPYERAAFGECEAILGMETQSATMKATRS